MKAVRVLQYMPAVTASAMVLHPRWSTLPLAIWLILMLLDAAAFGGFKDVVRKHSAPWPIAFRWFAFGSIAIYALMALGMVWTEHAHLGWFALEVKFSMFLLPLLFSYHWRRFGGQGLNWVPNAMAAGLVGFMFWRLGVAVVSNDPEAWRYDGLAGPFHPTYMGMYLAMMGWLIPFDKRWAAAILALCGVFVGLLASKAAWLVVAGLWLVQGVYRLLKHFKGAGALLIGVAFLLVGAWLGDGGRWQEFAGHFQRPEVQIVTESGASEVALEAIPEATVQHVPTDQPTAPKSGSTAGRIQAWEASVALLKASPGGVGTGDVVDELVKQYESEGADYALKKRMNPHSVWLQMAVSHGWLGLLVVLGWWAGTLVLSRRTGSVLLGVWAVVWVLNGTIESLLEMQQGIVPTILLGCVFALIGGESLSDGSNRD
jgi:hypothetical protein